jgi:hypothetical protein
LAPNGHKPELLEEGAGKGDLLARVALRLDGDEVRFAHKRDELTRRGR